MVSLNKALLNPYFSAGYLRGGWLTSHDMSLQDEFCIQDSHFPLSMIVGRSVLSMILEIDCMIRLMVQKSG